MANRSAFPTGPVALALYAQGDDKQKFATSTIPSISGKQDSAATLHWDTAGLERGGYQFYIVANAPGGADAYTDPEHFEVVPPGVITAEVGSADRNKGIYAGALTATQVDTPAQELPAQNPVPTLLPTPAPTTVDFAITGITANPSGAAMQGQRVEIIVTVRNNGSAAARIPVQLTFPSASKKPERQSPWVAPGAVARVVFTWKTRDYAIGRHTLRAGLQAGNNITAGATSATLELLVTAPQTAAAIVGIGANAASTTVGEPVAITVRVRNDGPIAASIPVTLHFPSDAKQPETRQPRVASGATGIANFTWRTGNYQPGNHTLRATISVDHSAGSTDASVSVALTAPPVIASIVGISAGPSPAVAGQPVHIAVTVRNDGPVAASIPVTLHFPSDSKQPETRRPRIAAGQTAVATFIWRTGDYTPGNHTLRATIAVDESSGLTDDSVSVALTAPPILASIIGIAAEPSLAVAGQPVSIAVTVRNDGPVAASIPVTLHFPSDDKQPETRRPHIAAGQTAVVTFVWHTGDYSPGNHALRAAIAVDESAGLTDASVSVDLTAPLVIGSIVGIATEPSPAVVGQLVSIAVTVRNDGPVEASIPVTLHFPSDDKQPETRRPRIAAGQNAMVTFIWRTGDYAPGNHALRATIAVDESTGLTDDSVSVALTAPPILASIVGISAGPSPAVAGQPVHIAVTVRNDGPVAASIPVTLHFPSDSKQPETRRPRIAPGETAAAAFIWRTGFYGPGVHALRAEVPGADAGIRVELTAPPSPAAKVKPINTVVDVAAVALYPPSPNRPIVKGDWVEVAAFVRNVGTADARATVRLRDLTYDKVMYSKQVSLAAGESRIVEFTWKTLRYAVGKHTLQVNADAGYDRNAGNDDTDTATVTVLTNRDITVGFGGSVPDYAYDGAAGKPSIRARPEPITAVALLPAGAGAGASEIALNAPGVVGAFADVPEAGVPEAFAATASPAFRLRQAAQTSPLQCVRYQRAMGNSQPRPALCPEAPALVR